MENIKHKNYSVNGINMHVAEIGEGPAVLFLHGFPDIWYSWRHQMVYLATKGYRAIAPDLRGYGDSDVPEGGATSYTAFHVVGDLVALLKTLDLDKVFLVGHDWGAVIAWYFVMFRPDLITALVNLSVVFRPRNPAIKPLDGFRLLFGDDYYICRFQAPGEAEEDIGKYDTAELMKAMLTIRDPGPPIIPKEVGFGIFLQIVPPTLPDWLTMDDVNYYATKFKQTGFTGGFNYYRAMDL
ncbi:OLC1v1004313C2 [Oldenlandia corymbosa var. corymbosa]|nr:OLC1v1004313C2 [Oldenlandia corymbosa var. corymbosa]